MGSLQLLEKIAEQLGNGDAISLAGLLQHPNAEIHTALAHREHPSISREKVAVKKECCLANTSFVSIRVGALGESDVAWVVREQTGTASDDRIDAVCPYEHSATVANALATARGFHGHAASIEGELRYVGLLMGGRAGFHCG